MESGLHRLKQGLAVRRNIWGARRSIFNNFILKGKTAL